MIAVSVNASPLGLFIALIGGIFSIISPCVLPILPGLVGVVSGSTISELENDKSLLKKIVSICILFSLGFTFVYAIIAIATTQLSDLFISNNVLLTRIGGALLIIFALFILLNHFGYLKYLGAEKRPLLNSKFTNTSAFVVGAAFAFGWSPCIGPIMAGVLVYASTEHSIISRVSIISAYCLGLCFAMSVIVYSTFKYKRYIAFLKLHLNIFTYISITILLFFGIILLLNEMSFITAQLTHFLDLVGLDKLITVG